VAYAKRPRVLALLTTATCLAATAAAQAPAPAAAPAAKTAAAADPVARPLGLDATTLQRAIAAIPRFAELANGFTLQSAADADAALRRGSRHRGHVDPWTIMPASFAWSPAPDTELWVLNGRSGGHAMLAVLRALPDGRVEHAASLIIDEPDSSLAVGAAAAYPKQLVWSTCYGCPGEGGAVVFGDDGKVEITYR